MKPAHRIVLAGCGLACGSYSAIAAFRNGMTLGATPIDAIAFGVAFAAVVVGSWFLIVAIRAAKGLERRLLQLGWVVCVGFVLVNAVGFVSLHRTETVEAKAVDIAAYERAQDSLDVALSELEAMKANRRWERTAGCTDATVAKSIEFCEAVAATQATIATARETLEHGRPGASDPQAATLAWVTRLDTGTVSKGLPILLGVVTELAAILFVAAATKPNAAAKPVRERKASVRRRRRVRRRAAQVVPLQAAS